MAIGYTHIQPQPRDVTSSQELRDLVALWRERIAALNPNDYDNTEEIHYLTACCDALEERIGK